MKVDAPRSAPGRMAVRPGDLDELCYLSKVVSLASLCGLGQAAGAPINSALHFFGDEAAALAIVSG